MTTGNWFEILFCAVFGAMAGAAAQSVGVGIISGLLCAVVIGVWRTAKRVKDLIQMWQEQD